MARSPDREMVVRLRTELQACQRRARLAFLAVTEIESSLMRLAMAAPIIALPETNQALQGAMRLVRLLRGEEVTP